MDPPPSPWPRDALVSSGLGGADRDVGCQVLGKRGVHLPHALHPWASQLRLALERRCSHRTPLLCSPAPSPSPSTQPFHEQRETCQIALLAAATYM